jgi:hypothetical protein
MIRLTNLVHQALSFAGWAFIMSACQATKEVVHDAQPFVDVGCTLVEAMSSDSTVHTVCATEHELASIAALVQNMQSDAGAPRLVERCSIVPHTSTCATRAQLVSAIDTTLEMRPK